MHLSSAASVGRSTTAKVDVLQRAVAAIRRAVARPSTAVVRLLSVVHRPPKWSMDNSSNIATSHETAPSRSTGYKDFSVKDMTTEG